MLTTPLFIEHNKNIVLAECYGNILSMNVIEHYEKSSQFKA